MPTLVNLIYSASRIGNIGILGFIQIDDTTREETPIRVPVFDGQPCPHCVSDWPVELLDFLGKVIAEGDEQMEEFKKKKLVTGGLN